MRAGERLTEQQRRVALLMAEAGVKDASHLHRIIETNSPELVDRVTVSRYLYNPPRRLNYTVVKAMASALNVTPDALVAAISRPTDIRPGSSVDDLLGMLRRADDLVGTAANG